ncbi:MAG: FKBP-type peptidyl-prolyl cis-trans isomerase [Reichenbachiella sp.]
MTELKTEDQQFSYGLGQSVGQNFKNEGFEKVLDLDAFIGGLSDAFAGNSELTGEEINAIIQKKVSGLKEGQFKEVKGDGIAFLKENSTKDGITTLESGLQYQIVESGDANGAKPEASSTVTTHYTGQLIDGKVFDSSVQRGEPSSFPVNGVIAGWTEALQLMVPGDKWKLFIPFELAYGERGAGQDIPPFAALIFDIELISIA